MDQSCSARSTPGTAGTDASAPVSRDDAITDDIVYNPLWSTPRRSGCTAGPRRKYPTAPASKESVAPSSAMRGGPDGRCGLAASGRVRAARGRAARVEVSGRTCRDVGELWMEIGRDVWPRPKHGCGVSTYRATRTRPRTSVGRIHLAVDRSWMSVAGNSGHWRASGIQPRTSVFAAASTRAQQGIRRSRSGLLKRSSSRTLDSSSPDSAYARASLQRFPLCPGGSSFGTRVARRRVRRPLSRRFHRPPARSPGGAQGSR